MYTVSLLYSACTAFDFMVDLYPLINALINAHLAMYSIWRRDSTAKGVKKKYIADFNVIRLQYFMIGEIKKKLTM